LTGFEETPAADRWLVLISRVKSHKRSLPPLPTLHNMTVFCRPWGLQAIGKSCSSAFNDKRMVGMQDFLVLQQSHEAIVPDDWQKEDRVRKSAREAKLAAAGACRFQWGFASQLFSALQSIPKTLISVLLSCLLAVCRTCLGKKVRALLQSKVSVFPSGLRSATGDGC
jgi:hypothetical protein